MTSELHPYPHPGSWQADVSQRKVMAVPSRPKADESQAFQRWQWEQCKVPLYANDHT